MDQKTFLHDEQLSLGGKMVSFAGWEMPVQYTGILDEHKTVRERVGLFDVSHMGEIFVSGRDSLEFLQKIVPQDVAKLTQGKAVYCQLTNKNGVIIDDLIIYKIRDEKYLLIVNASRINGDLNHMVRNALGFSVEIENQSHNYSLLAIQGPLASNLMAKMGLEKAQQPEYFTIKPVEFYNINVYISRTGYTGEDGFEILVKNDFSAYLWSKLLKAGKEFDIKPIGLGARDSLRLEAALHLYGNDLDEETTPVEAGLSWSIPKEKTYDYNGKEQILNQIEHGTTKKLIGFKMVGKAVARHDYEVFYNGDKVGKVTSGGPSPTLGENIGLAYVNTSVNISLDSKIEIMIREKLYEAVVVKRPFVKKRTGSIKQA